MRSNSAPWNTICRPSSAIAGGGSHIIATSGDRFINALEINDFFEERQLLQYRTFGYGHSFGVLSHYYGREAGLELREDIDTVLEPGMVISMEPMLTIGEGQPGAGGYREHDILVITEDGNEDITKYPYGPEFNVVG